MAEILILRLTALIVVVLAAFFDREDGIVIATVIICTAIILDNLEKDGRDG